MVILPSYGMDTSWQIGTRCQVLANVKLSSIWEHWMHGRIEKVTFNDTDELRWVIWSMWVARESRNDRFELALTEDFRTWLSLAAKFSALTELC